MIDPAERRKPRPPLFTVEELWVGVSVLVAFWIGVFALGVGFGLFWFGLRLVGGI